MLAERSPAALDPTPLCKGGEGRRKKHLSSVRMGCENMGEKRNLDRYFWSPYFSFMKEWQQRSKTSQSTPTRNFPSCPYFSRVYLKPWRWDRSLHVSLLALFESILSFTVLSTLAIYKSEIQFLGSRLHPGGVWIYICLPPYFWAVLQWTEPLLN